MLICMLVLALARCGRFVWSVHLVIQVSYMPFSPSVSAFLSLASSSLQFKGRDAKTEELSKHIFLGNEASIPQEWHLKPPWLLVTAAQLDQQSCKCSLVPHCPAGFHLKGRFTFLGKCLPWNKSHMRERNVHMSTCTCMYESPWKTQRWNYFHQNFGRHPLDLSNSDLWSLILAPAEVGAYFYIEQKLCIFSPITYIGIMLR